MENPSGEALERLQTCFIEILEKNLLGIYLHGSLAFGCFHPRRSDIDALVVVKEPLTGDVKQEIARALLAIWHLAPEKGYEVSVVLERDCRHFIYPTPYEFHFSKDWQERFRQDPQSICDIRLKTDPDLAAHFAVTRQCGITLYGPPAASVFARVPAEAYFASVLSDVADSRQTVRTEPVYTILNLCRTLAYLRDGKIRSKAEGGQWGEAFFTGENRRLVIQALHAYQTGLPTAFDSVLCEDFCAQAMAAIEVLRPGKDN